MDTAFFERLGIIDFALAGFFILLALGSLAVSVGSDDPDSIVKAERVGAVSTLLALLALLPIIIFSAVNLVGWLLNG